MQTPTVREIYDYIAQFPAFKHTTEQVMEHFLGPDYHTGTADSGAVDDRLQRARRWATKLKRRKWAKATVLRQHPRSSQRTTKLWTLEEGA